MNDIKYLGRGRIGNPMARGFLTVPGRTIYNYGCLTGEIKGHVEYMFLGADALRMLRSMERLVYHKRSSIHNTETIAEDLRGFGDSVEFDGRGLQRPQFSPLTKLCCYTPVTFTHGTFVVSLPKAKKGKELRCQSRLTTKSRHSTLTKSVRCPRV